MPGFVWHNFIKFQSKKDVGKVTWRLGQWPQIWWWWWCAGFQKCQPVIVASSVKNKKSAPLLCCPRHVISDCYVHWPQRGLMPLAHRSFFTVRCDVFVGNCTQPERRRWAREWRACYTCFFFALQRQSNEWRPDTTQCTMHSEPCPYIFIAWPDPAVPEMRNKLRILKNALHHHRPQAATTKQDDFWPHTKQI